MIAVTCSSCHKKLAVKDELAGRKGKCPGCGAPLTIPHPAATSAGQVRPRSGNLEARAVLPPVRAEGEQCTLGGERKGETTGAWSGAGQSPALWDFLAPPQQPDEIGRLGPYRVLQVLGSGGMGVVYKAEDPHLKRAVALKVMLPSLGASEPARQRFVREAQAAAAIDHDHIVHIYQVGEDRGVPFLAMQFLQGEPLDERLKRDGRLPLAEVLRVGRETAEGLAAAHERGLIHRDIKPANLWLEGDRGRVKILDFGLARAVGDQAQLTQSGAIVGTPAYMAPEQAGGRTVDARCDLFSLGCVLYRMASGEMPFKGSDTLSVLSALALETPPPPCELHDDVPRPLSDLVMRLLAKKPEERPESAAAVANALQKMQEQPPAAKGPSDKGKTLTGSRVPAARSRPDTGLRKRLRAAKPVVKKTWLPAAAVAGVVLLAQVGLRVGGVFKVRTPNGTGAPGPAPAPARDSLDPWFAPGTRWEGKLVFTEPFQGERTAWFIVNAREGNRFRGRYVHENRGDWTIEGVLENDHSSFTWKFADQAVNEWSPDRVPFEAIEATGKWKDAHTRVDFTWPQPGGKPRLGGFIEFTTKRVLSKPGDGNQWPPSLHPGQAACGPTWRVQGEELVQEEVVDVTAINFGDLSWQEYDIRMKAMKTQGQNGFIVIFDKLRPSKQTQWCIGMEGNRNNVEAIEFLPTGNQRTIRAGPTPITVVDKRWYPIHIKARGKRVECFLDGQRQFQFTDPDRRGGRVGITCMHMAARFKDIEITAADGKVLWKGPPELP